MTKIRITKNNLDERVLDVINQMSPGKEFTLRDIKAKFDEDGKRLRNALKRWAERRIITTLGISKWKVLGNGARKEKSLKCPACERKFHPLTFDYGLVPTCPWCGEMLVAEGEGD